MQQLKGKGIEKGIAIGRIFFYNKEKDLLHREKIENVDAEIKRYETAKARASERLQKLYDKALAEVGKERAAIFEVHQMMLDDGGYNDSVLNIIKTEKVCAEYAVAATETVIVEKFDNTDDDLIKARSADIKDISESLIRILSGKESVSAPLEPVILVADDLTPSETMQFDRSKLLAVVTLHGSANSHTAILAGMMGLPYVIGVDIEKSWNGRQAVVDGYKGTITIDPDDEYMREMVAARQRDEEHRKYLRQLKGKPCMTKGGRRIKLCANISGVSDAGAALDNDAEGVGLLRSEFLYMESKDFPTENTLFQAYKSIVQKMAGRQVVIRTLDLGADKQVGYLDLGKENNPALGCRGIRVCLDRPDIFKTQLRAIYRASAYGNVAVMFPMIISLDEVLQCKKYVEEVKQELKAENIPYSEDVEVGIMIETPAAALISGALAKEVDFFSIGTNDLTQYALAVDRNNAKLDAISDLRHPAVLELIRMTIENGHKGGAWVGICGELAADTSLTAKFIEYGVDELSVSPENILPVKAEIVNTE